MKKRFAVLGSGMQGTAAAFDLAKFADPAEVVLADTNLEQAARSANRVNKLIGSQLCRPFQLNALDPSELTAFLRPIDVLLSCVPYWMHPKIANIAISTGTNMCDLGGNTDITLQTLALNDRAIAAGVTLIPDTGLAPGFVNSIGLYLMEQFDQPESVKLYCGVLPQHPVPPFNYKLTFNVEGLLTEYMYQAVALRDSEIVHLDTLAEVEEIAVDGFGLMEAFNTSGGTSTAPYSFKGRLKNYQYKTIRWPGHCEHMRVFRDLGLWGEDPIDVKGQCIKPKDVFCKVFGESLGKIKDVDQCLIRGVGTGVRDGDEWRIQVDVHDKQCDETGFTSMERTTGFSIAIHAAAIASGTLPKGCLRYESALTGTTFCNEMKRRGIKINISKAKA